MQFRETVGFSVQALRANKVRTFLTALGLMIGNASVILVVTISITGRDYVLDEIRAIGSNIIYASYQVSGNTNADADFVKLSDVDAVRRELRGRIAGATGVIVTHDRFGIAGKEEDVKIVGADDQYAQIRNLKLLAGRFLDPGDIALRQKVAVLTESLARRLYGSQSNAIGQLIKIHGLAFTVTGTFKERGESFGLSELSDETILIPVTVVRYFTASERVDPLYVQAQRAQDVGALTTMVREIIEGRHRPGAQYDVSNFSAILDAARKTALILSVVLLFVSAIALIISGIGVMNIMLVTVSERTREIGLRMALGASRRQILRQFLVEAVLISFSGGLIGVCIGVATPAFVSLFLNDLQIPVSPVSVAISLAVSVCVGVIFGLLPANRASNLNPTEALRYE